MTGGPTRMPETIILAHEMIERRAYIVALALGFTVSVAVLGLIYAVLR